MGGGLFFSYGSNMSCRYIRRHAERVVGSRENRGRGFTLVELPFGKLRTVSKRERSAFTLVELLVVIAIIGILVALLLPAIQAAREAARRAHCVNNMKQIGIATHLHHDQKKFYPQYHAAVIPAGQTEVNYTYTWPGPVWTVALLPFIEEQSLFDAFNKKVVTRDPSNVNYVTRVISTYVCPSNRTSQNPIFEDRADAGGNNPPRALGLYYAASMGPTEPDACHFCPVGTTGSATNYCCQSNEYGWRDYSGAVADSSTGMFGRNMGKRKFKQVTDGLTNTFLIGETLPEECAYQSAFAPNFSLAGTTIPLNTFEKCLAPPGCHNRGCGFKSPHPGGCHFAMADGSVHFVDEAIGYQIYNQLGTRAGGDIAELP